MCTLFNFNYHEDFNNIKSIYDIKIHSIQGEMIDMKDYKGKYILFVNVASNCGFTNQYNELEELYQLYKDKLVIIGVPCNQFLNQEPGTDEEIFKFCQENYNISFLLTEKIEVKGLNQNDLYKWLTKKDINGALDSSVKWNFQKYLIDQRGNLVDYFYSTTSPMSSKITSYLK